MATIDGMAVGALGAMAWGERRGVGVVVEGNGALEVVVGEGAMVAAATAAVEAGLVVGYN